MAAASPPTASIPLAGDTSAPIPSLLRSVDELHRAALAVHLASPNLVSEDDFDELAERLVNGLSQLLKIAPPSLSNANKQPPQTSASVLSIECRELGRHALLMIRRVERLFTEDDGSLNRAEFCSRWTRAEVDVFGERVSELSKQWNDMHSRGFSDDIIAPDAPLSQLSVSSPPVPGLPSSITSETDTAIHETQPAQLMKKTKPKSAIDIFKANRAKDKSRSPQAGIVTASDGLLTDFILDSLAYKSMHDREGEVTPAHKRTLEWIFDDEPCGDALRDHFTVEFNQWLSSNDLGPIYWITGKPGSGKSTFMRFIFQNHAATKTLEESWEGGKPLAKAGFFFWTSGSREQRSQTGLLRYLLHQLLSANPGLMPSTFADLWARLKTMTTKERISLTLDWTIAELKAAFQAFVDAALPGMKLCLFIDGLDEFEGSHIEIIDFFKQLGLGKHGSAIKMCLSSRPWDVFEKAFQNTVPNFRLQDLTYQDMQRYAKDKLSQHNYVRRLLENDLDFRSSLVKNMVDRADGVFLWVRLAIDQMLARAKPDITRTDLVNRLQALPTELNKLFAKLIFENKSDKDIMESGMLFQLIRAREIVSSFINDESSNSLTVWELAFALQDSGDDELALSAPVLEPTEEQVEARVVMAMQWVYRSFQGLLDCHLRSSEDNERVRKLVDASGETRKAVDADEAERRVTYIHRTVRDWLMEEPGIYDRMVAATAAHPCFDGHLRLLRSYVLRLKNPLEEIEHHRRLDDWWADISLALTHARHISTFIDKNHLQRQFINELNETISWYWLPKPSNLYDHWAASAFGSFEIRMKAPPIWQPFLCLATKFGLKTYLEEELAARIESGETCPLVEDGGEENDDSIPLLSYATEFLCSHQKTIYPLSSPELVDMLLQTPSNLNRGVNYPYKDFVTRKPRTPWIAVLRHLRDARRRGWIQHPDESSEGEDGGSARWEEIVRLFLAEGGADVDAVVQADTWDPEISALGVFELLDETYGLQGVKELKDLLIQLKE